MSVELKQNYFNGKPAASEIALHGIDNMIVQGYTYERIAKKCNVPLLFLVQWVMAGREQQKAKERTKRLMNAEIARIHQFLRNQAAPAANIIPTTTRGNGPEGPEGPEGTREV